MAIQPIDAQILFSRLNQMGKEQAEQKDGQLHTQIVQGQQIAKRAEDAAHRVAETQETEEDELRQVKDEARRHHGQGKKSGADGEAEEEGEDGNTPRESIREAYLGKKIDITG